MDKTPRTAIEYHCPVEATLDVIGGKWKVVILYWLRDETRRYSDLSAGKSRASASGC